MAILNTNIENIKKGSSTEILYNRLLSGLIESSQDKLPDFTGPDYVTSDGSVNVNKINEEINSHYDISRKNSAYMFANSIVSSLGVGESGGISGAVSISGDSMTGKLYTLYGFAAGENGVKILEVARIEGETEEDTKNYVTIDGELHIGSNGLWMNNENVISYKNKVLSIDSMDISLNGNVSCSHNISVGDIKINKDNILYKEHIFYNSGNSNIDTVDWTMKNGTVSGNLEVIGTSNLSDKVTANGGVELGYNNKKIIDINNEDKIDLYGDLNIIYGGIKFNDEYIVHIKNQKVVSFSASNKVLNLGDDGTNKITLQTGLYDDDGEYELISKFGSAYFPESFKACHGFSDTLIGTYRVSSEDSGVVAYRYFRLGSEDGPGLKSDGTKISFEAPFRYVTNVGDEPVQITDIVNGSLGYEESTSLYAPLNRKSASLCFKTDADFYVFDKPVECLSSIGISGSKTRILENQLFFRDGVYWLAIEDGVKYYGNAYLNDSIGSTKFSSGFAGSGWKIYKNELTGNISATFDELTIRKKMRIYELEVQKHQVTNGSLWISDSCSGDIVEEII